MITIDKLEAALAGTSLYPVWNNSSTANDVVSGTATVSINLCSYGMYVTDLVLSLNSQADLNTLKVYITNVFNLGYNSACQKLK